MLYWLSYALEDHFGPFRLLRSHALLLAFGTFALPTLCITSSILSCEINTAYRKYSGW